MHSEKKNLSARWISNPVCDENGNRKDLHLRQCIPQNLCAHICVCSLSCSDQPVFRSVMFKIFASHHEVFVYLPKALASVMELVTLLIRDNDTSSGADSTAMADDDEKEKHEVRDESPTVARFVCPTSFPPASLSHSLIRVYGRVAWRGCHAGMKACT